MSETIPLLKDYLSRAELAQQLGKNERTLIRWEEQRIGPPVTKIGRKVFYRISGVMLWLQSREHEMIRERARRDRRAR